VAFTTQPTYTVTDKGQYSVRAANEMGGLSAASAAVAVSATAIQTITEESALSAPETIFTLDGKRISHLQRGLNIVHRADGRIVKVMR